MKRILVIAPHPDDEILGCGATIAKEAALGNEVYVIIATNAEKGAPGMFPKELILKARQEALFAHQLLGVKETVFLDFPAPMLDQYPQFKISSEFSNYIKKWDIEVVYVPHRGDRHVDHYIVHDCAMVSCRPLANCSVNHVYAYETLSETEWGEPNGANTFVPTKFTTFAIDEFEIKLEAMKCFETQLYPFPASRSLEAIEALGKYRGASVSSYRAEAFEVLREID